MNKNPKLHYGHFSRIRKSVMQDDAPINDTIALEAVLQFAFRRTDTNEIAKSLLHHYGSLGNIIENATANELINFYGIGKTTSERIITLLRLLKRAQNGEFRAPKPIDTIHYFDIKGMIENEFEKAEYEKVVAYYLNRQKQIIFNVVLNHGNADQVELDKHRVLHLAQNHNASFVVLAHNHLNGSFLPSVQDLNLTASLCKFLLSNDIVLLDHLIYADGNIFSFASSLIMSAIMRRIEHPEFSR